MIRIAVAAVAPLLLAAAPGTPKLDMIAFFTGKTHAENMIKIAFHRPHKLVADSIGGRNKEGQFVLIDTVHEEGKPAVTRTWVMHPVSPDHFAGVLSDAVGPVDVIVSGDTATIRYVLKDGHLKVTQRIQLQGDGKTLSNNVVARKFGITFARVDGMIRKLD